MVTIDMAHDDALREVPFARETIYDGHILHVEKWWVTCPNGREAPREIVVHKGAAAVVPVFDNGDTLLVRQHRVAVDRVTLEIPAGKLDSVSEDPLDCATRELREETGLSAERMTCLTTHPDEDEFLGLARLPLEEAFEMVMRGEICDSKTICGLMMAREIVARQKA